MYFDCTELCQLLYVALLFIQAPFYRYCWLLASIQDCLTFSF